MASRVHYCKEELQSLLEVTAEEVTSILLAPTTHHDQVFFENFTNISLRAVKYLAASLNHLTPDQQLGRTVDRLAQGFAQAMREYRGRNVFAHSVQDRSSEGPGGGEDDQIYHFLNTRNKLLPVECLSTYENDRQRRELEQFVQEMKKHEAPKREQKRSLMLPKDPNFELKIGRKRTYDPSPLAQTEECTKQEEVPPPAPPLPLPIFTENVETQTENFLQSEVEQKKTDVDIPSQCISVSVSEAAFATLSQNQLALPAQRKDKKKGLMDSDSKSKKKAKFATSQVTTKPVDPPGTSKSIGKRKVLQQQPSQCSLKLVKLNEKVLSMCSREVNLIVSNADEIVININYTPSDCHILPNDTHSSAILFDEAAASNPSQSTLQKMEIQHSQQSLKVASDRVLQMDEAKNLLQTASQESGNSNKKYIIMKSAKPTMKQSQRLPISTIKIADCKENDPQADLRKQMRMKHTDSVLISEGKAKASMKKKKYTGERHLFQSFMISETESDNNLSQHLRSSKININAQLLESLVKKESENSDKSLKFPSFAKNEGDSLSSSLSQDYLVSREKSDPQQLISRLVQLEKQTNGGEEQWESQHRDTPNFNRNSCNFSSEASRVEQVRKGNQMIRISNAHQLAEEIGSKLRMEHSKFFENNKISADIEKDKPIDTKKPLPKHSFLKKSHLSLIPQNQRPEYFDSALLNKSSLDSVARNDLQANEAGAQGQHGPFKSIFYRQATEILPVRVAMGKLKEQARWNGSKSTPHHKVESSSAYSSSTEVEDLKRKMRNRGYKDKLLHYLELIEATHERFCGPNCEHLRELLAGKEGSIADQIVRLFRRLK